MVAVNAAVISLRGDGSANGKASRDAHRSRQSDEVSVKIRAIARTRVAGINSVATSPAGTVSGIAHCCDHVVVERAGASKVSGFAARGFFGDGAEGFVGRHQVFG